MMGKWSLPCGSSVVDHEEGHIRLGEHRDMSIAMLGLFGRPRWVTEPEFRIQRPAELMKS
jgi:hypothetical protein